MLLVSFTVQNFRSITTAYKLHLGRSTVLIGPNNEGKSNILKALVVGMKVLTLPAPVLSLAAKGTHIGYQMRQIYNWKADFPIPRQHSSPSGASVIEFEFELSESETAQFRQTIKSNLNGTLPIQVSVGQSGVKIKVTKKGPGGMRLPPRLTQTVKTQYAVR